ncbi:radical SAM protein [Candidatus Latescibacterota bacterium]
MATLSEKVKLFRGLVDGEVARRGPFTVLVDITRRCNLHCIGCRYHSTEVHMPSPTDQSIMDISVDLFTKLCHELVTMGTREIILTGEGEPFFHPRIFDIIAIAKQTGFRIQAFTNGTPFNEPRLQTLIDSGLDNLMVSLWAGTYEGYRKNYPQDDPENFNRIVAALKRLSQLKAEQKRTLPWVVLYYTIYRNNFQEVTTLVDLASATQSNKVNFSLLKTRRGVLDSYVLAPDEERALVDDLTAMGSRLDARSIDHNIPRTLQRYQIGERVWEKLPCYVGWVQAHVKVDGTVFPCHPCDLPMGNAAEDTFGEIWNGPAFRAFRRQTITREGLAAMGQHCDCSFCRHVEDNIRIHRLFRWFAPLFAGKNEEGTSPEPVS